MCEPKLHLEKAAGFKLRPLPYYENESLNKHCSLHTQSSSSSLFALLSSLRLTISGPKQFFFRGHNYFFSGHVPELADKKVDWLDGRNICREYCMDLVSLETQEENNMIFRLIQQSKIFGFCCFRIS